MIDIEKYRKKAKEILINFCDVLDLDGEALFGSSDDCNIYLVNLEKDTKAQYIPPAAMTITEMLRNGMSMRDIISAQELGFILVNKEYFTEGYFEPEELLETLVHEMIHSKRNLLIYDYFREMDQEKRSQPYNTQAYTFQMPPKKEKKKQPNKELTHEKPQKQIYTTTKRMEESYADASQGILKGIIHQDDKLMKRFYDMSTEDYAKYDKKTQKNKNDKMKMQQEIDEALVSTMALVAVFLEGNKNKTEKKSIGQLIKGIKKMEKETTVGTMCKIIERHLERDEDLDLFYWMLDPIGYSNGDIHYDFFSDYTKKDQDLLEEFFHDVKLSDGKKGSRVFGKRKNEKKNKLSKEVDTEER